MTETLTVKDVAKRLKVNERTVYRLAKAGKLPGFKVAGSWRFLAEDIDGWIQQEKRAVVEGGQAK